VQHPSFKYQVPSLETRALVVRSGRVGSLVKAHGSVRMAVPVLAGGVMLFKDLQASYLQYSQTRYLCAMLFFVMYVSFYKRELININNGLGDFYFYFLKKFLMKMNLCSL